MAPFANETEQELARQVANMVMSDIVGMIVLAVMAAVGLMGAFLVLMLIAHGITYLSGRRW